MEHTSHAPRATPTIVDPRTGARRPTSELVDHFASVWADPAAHRYRFLALFSEDIRLVAPLAGRTRGQRAGYAAFRRTFALMPDLTAIVDDWEASDRRVWIAMRFVTKSGGRRLEWPSIDLLGLEDGIVISRRAYFDSIPVLSYVARSPTSLARWARVRLGPAPSTFPDGVSSGLDTP